MVSEQLRTPDSDTFQMRPLFGQILDEQKVECAGSEVVKDVQRLLDVPEQRQGIRLWRLSTGATTESPRAQHLDFTCAFADLPTA
jgi:hypothetical protein